MSRENITERIPTKTGIILGFETRDGRVRFYEYQAQAAAAIGMGADPKNVVGTEISEQDAHSRPSGSGLFGDLLDLAEDAAEGVAELL